MRKASLQHLASPFSSDSKDSVPRYATFAWLGTIFYQPPSSSTAPLGPKLCSPVRAEGIEKHDVTNALTPQPIMPRLKPFMSTTTLQRSSGRQDSSADDYFLASGWGWHAPSHRLATVGQYMRGIPVADQARISSLTQRALLAEP